MADPKTGPRKIEMKLKHLMTEKKGSNYDGDMAQEDRSQSEAAPKTKSKTSVSK